MWTDYRFRRRTFLSAVAGAVGFEILLRNVEASAEGTPIGPRLLAMHWLLGTVAAHFEPQGSGTTYTTSRILKPFETAGLRDDMIVLNGFTYLGLRNMGGAAEGGTVLMMTSVSSPGTRANRGEIDDTVAGGPSWDQILLERVPGMKRPGPGFATAAADARVDSYETSARCLSYSHETRSIPASRPEGTQVVEHVPLMPELSPSALFVRLFAGFIPGPDGAGKESEALRALRLRKSVLDSSLRELARLKTLAPASEAATIDAHAEAIRKAEKELSTVLNMPGGAACTLPPPPDPALRAPYYDTHFYYGNEFTDAGEEETHALIGKAHLGVIRAAMQCDIIRCATFQWAPSTSHVAFAGLYPGDERACRHHPISNALGPFPGRSEREQNGHEFLANVHTWYNQQTAEFLAEMKRTQDVFGSNLLDSTIVPFVTEKANALDSLRGIPALIFGGRNFGMQGGQYQDLGPTRPHTDFWLSIAQAFFPEADSPLEALNGEKFVQETTSYTGPIGGVWVKPT